MSAGNGRQTSPEQIQEVRDILSSMTKESNLTQEANLNLCDLFGKSYRRRTLTLMSCWVTGIVSYYALTLNAGHLAGDIFVNFAIGTLCDVPAIATIYFLVDRIGNI